MLNNRPAVLYVDDESSHLIHVQAELEDDFDVIVYESPQFALTDLVELDPCVILTELKLPTMNGLDFLAKTEELLPYAVRLIVSGNLPNLEVSKAVSSGKVFDTIQKPFIDGVLKKTLRQAFAKYLKEAEARKKRSKR